MKWIILVAGVAANAMASVLVKVAMSPPRSFPTLREPLSLLTNIPLLLGVVFYGVAFLLYALALSKLPLNVAHPILTAGAIATVAVLSAVLFREPFYWTTAIGLLLVICGVFLIAFRTGAT